MNKVKMLLLSMILFSVSSQYAVPNPYTNQEWQRIRQLPKKHVPSSDGGPGWYMYDVGNLPTTQPTPVRPQQKMPLPQEEIMAQEDMMPHYLDDINFAVQEPMVEENTTAPKLSLWQKIKAALAKYFTR